MSTYIKGGALEAEDEEWKERIGCRIGDMTKGEAAVPWLRRRRAKVTRDPGQIRDVVSYSDNEVGGQSSEPTSELHRM